MLRRKSSGLEERMDNMSEPNKKYQIDTAENRKFLEEIRNDLLRFGHRFPSPGGSSYYRGDDGTPWTDRSRETWITSRMVHVYSLGTFLGHEAVSYTHLDVYKRQGL